MTDDLHLISGFDEQGDVAIDLDRYVRLAGHVLRAERGGLEAELNLVFVDETTMADYHERFLDEPGPTDVMAFPMDEEVPSSGRAPDHGDKGPGSPTGAGDPPAILGDVLVCPAFAAREAAARDQAVTDELALLVVHGVLHLLGYDHAEPMEEQEMQQRQQVLLAEFAAVESADRKDDR